LRVITGASGGSMNAALTASALDRDFPHISARVAPTASVALTGNPFFDAWVNLIDIRPLLLKRDLEDEHAPLRSFLDCTVLDEIAKIVFAAPTAGTPLKPRPWLADTLRVALTLGNLRGLPYGIDFIGSALSSHHGLLAHSDHLRFACNFPNGTPVNAPLRDDEHVFSSTCTEEERRRLVNAAIGSGAFPLGLSARVIEQEYKKYAARQWAIDPKTQTARPIAPAGIGSLPPDGTYSFLTVDGGIINNEPFDLAHRILSGASGFNERDGKRTHRAVLMVDPFPEDPDLGPENFNPFDRDSGQNSPLSLFGTASALFSAWKNQCRFKPIDLALALDETVYSRYMVTPDRGPEAIAFKGGQYHLASGALGGFGGFLHREYRLHDYLLGRRNAERFFREHFALPVDAELFSGWAGKSFGDKFKTASGDHYSIIPVLSEVGDNPLRAWPVGMNPVPGLQESFTQRFNVIYDRIEHAIFADGFPTDQVLKLLRGTIKDKVWGKVQSIATKSLADRGL